MDRVSRYSHSVIGLPPELQRTQQKTMKHLKEGDTFPKITLKAQDDTEVSPSGKFILYIYPKDFTPGCTTQACDFRDEFAGFDSIGYKIYGISPDSLDSHQKFISEYKLPFTLLADPDLKAIKLLGAYGEKNMYGKITEGIYRSTFVVQDGVIQHAMYNVKATGHVQKLLQTISA